MPRIVYAFASGGGIAGGHKMILRHVETLRDLGFDAVGYTGEHNALPSWFAHDVPVIGGSVLRADDVIVLPDDDAEAVRSLLNLRQRTIIFSQNPYRFAASEAFDLAAAFPPQRTPDFLAVSPRLAATLRRAFPASRVEEAPCFADERLFRPGGDKAFAVAFVPRKRPVEAVAIRRMFGRFHPRHGDLVWAGLKDRTEAEVAQAFARAGLFLSLSHLESVGLTPLEAMASGCVCAGFTGIGGDEFATPDNGFWVPNEDCEAAADALAQAADLFRTGGAPLRARVEAGYETARNWSYARFRERLEAVWMSLAPEARLRQGPVHRP